MRLCVYPRRYVQKPVIFRQDAASAEGFDTFNFLVMPIASAVPPRAQKSRYAILSLVRLQERDPVRLATLPALVPEKRFLRCKRENIAHRDLYFVPFED